MITSKELNITEEDVLKEQNIEVLQHWSASLSEKMTSIKVYYNVANWAHLPKKSKAAYKFTEALYHIVIRRIKVVQKEKLIATGFKSKQQVKSERMLSMQFMKVAKETLTKDLYNKILEAAKQKIPSNAE